MKLSLGFSTCPNDTFIFDAIVNKRIDLEGLSFDFLITDVEYLNKQISTSSLDISKISYHAFAYVSEYYKILDSGSALGFNNGPLFICKNQELISKLPYLRIAIPGKFTTANLLFSIAYPDAQNKHEYVFSEIENAINAQEVDAGVIIHENRFTYHERGFTKILDLGEYWNQISNLPIPLGGIVIKNTIPLEVRHTFNRVLRRSIEFAFNNPTVSKDYIKNYAFDMNDEVISKHINLFVNEFSVYLGDTGRNAIKTLYSYAIKNEVIPDFDINTIFLPNLIFYFFLFKI
ncbi:MAG: 1,4-dihydroxy-6-naphthoate synthase [Bacteroidales bacterium]|nr:1,4-dihydroxy-6-naphthoate synthase [Bacteroidales bacterium]